MTISAATRAARVPEEQVLEVLRILIVRRGEHQARLAVQAIQARADLPGSVEDYCHPADGIFAECDRRMERAVANAHAAIRHAYAQKARELAESSSAIAPPPPGPALDLADALAALFATTAPAPTTEAPTTQD